MNCMKLENKVAIVTGASSGIGAATVKRFAYNGAKVILGARNEEKCKSLINEINEHMGVECVKYAYFDANDEKTAIGVVDECIDTYGKIDILFNNSGVMHTSCEIERTDIDEWNDSFNVNVTGYLFMCRAAKEHLVKTHGTIINNASIAGLHSYVIGRSYAYSASKAAVIQFSRQMAKNYGELGIRVNCICPGIIKTKMLGDRDVNEYAKRVPLGYVGEPDDVAKVVTFLASDDAAYLTGVVLPIDGGVSL